MQPVEAIAPWWTAIPWQWLLGSLAGLLTAASPTIIRYMKGREDKGKAQLAAAATEQDRADARLILAYNEAIKDRDREERLRYAAEAASSKWEKLAGHYYWRARELYHTTTNARQRADFLLARLLKVDAADDVPAANWEPIKPIPEDIETALQIKGE